MHCAATVRGRRVVVFVNTIFIIVPTLLPLKIKMPKIVLHYFDMPFWRAEVSRLALHLGKVGIHFFKNIILELFSILPEKYTMFQKHDMCMNLLFKLL